MISPKIDLREKLCLNVIIIIIRISILTQFNLQYSITRFATEYDTLLRSAHTELNETQREIQELAKKFTREEIIPVAAHYDRVGEYPREIVKKAWELGFTNAHIPAHCGKITGCFVTIGS